MMDNVVCRICLSLVFIAQPVVLFGKITILTKLTSESQVIWEHGAVMRSLKAGLNILQVPYNYNPQSVDEIGEIVVVPCGKSAFNQARLLKSHGHIKFLAVGPNFYPYEINYPEVDMYIVPSAPVIQYVQAVCPSIAARCRVSYAGVDADYWYQNPETKPITRDVVVYWKTEDESFCTMIESLLKRSGWIAHRIKYGAYAPQQFKDLLSTVRFAVFLSRSESQGLALAEAWSMNVPTLCWNPMSATVLGQTYTFLPSAPYLNDQVGKEWKTIADFEELLLSIEQMLPSFCPRAWVLNHMTDAIAVQLFMDIVHETINELDKE